MGTSLFLVTFCFWFLKKFNLVPSKIKSYQHSRWVVSSRKSINRVRREHRAHFFSSPKRFNFQVLRQHGPQEVLLLLQPAMRCSSAGHRLRHYGRFGPYRKHHHSLHRQP